MKIGFQQKDWPLGAAAHMEVSWLEIDGVPYVPPQHWEAEVIMCVDKHGVVRAYNIGSPAPPDSYEFGRVTLEFGHGWARVKPTKRDRELAKAIRDNVIIGRGLMNKDMLEAADRLDGGENKE